MFVENSYLDGIVLSYHYTYLLGMWAGGCVGGWVYMLLGEYDIDDYSGERRMFMDGWMLVIPVAYILSGSQLLSGRARPLIIIGLM